MRRPAAKTSAVATAAAPAALPAARDGDVAFLIDQAGRSRAKGDLARAEVLLRQAVQIAPGSVPAATNHGLLLAELGRHVEAAELLRRTVAMAPTFAPAWINLALALRGRGDIAGAEAAQAEARRLDPQSAAARVAEGLSAQSAGQLGRALAAYRAAVQVEPDLPEAWINLGLALHEAGDTQGCRVALEQALRLRPHDRRALSNLLMTSHYNPALTLADLRQMAERAALGWPAVRSRPRTRERGASGDQRPRLGYLSGDLYAHPVGWLLGPVLRAHDRGAVQVHVFDHRVTGEPALPDPVTQRLRGAAEHWHSVASLDDQALAQAIRDAGIDVLVDLAGHTQGARLGALAERPAPVQLSWLGYFGSTGLPMVDAVVLGAALAPPGAEEAYTEAIERIGGGAALHFAWEPPDWAPTTTPAPSAARGHITFGSFNNPAKLNDAVVLAWAQVLRAVPGSRLVLKWKTLADDLLAARLRQRFAAQGVSADRLELRAASPHPQMLAEYGDIDIALDPFPFSGLITTLEALWMGVPVITLPQQRSVSRQTAAVLGAIGQTAWVARTPRDLVRIAAALAADLPCRQALRGDGPASLRARMRAGALMDGAPVARAIEALARRRLEAASEAMPRVASTPS